MSVASPALTLPLTPAAPGEAIWTPYSWSRVQSTSINSTSITTSGRALSMAAMMREAACTRSGVSFTVMPLVPLMGAMRRRSTTTRSRSIVSFTSALLR